MLLNEHLRTREIIITHADLFGLGQNFFFFFVKFCGTAAIPGQNHWSHEMLLTEGLKNITVY